MGMTFDPYHTVPTSKSLVLAYFYRGTDIPVIVSSPFGTVVLGKWVVRLRIESLLHMVVFRKIISTKIGDDKDRTFGVKTAYLASLPDNH